MVFVLLQSKMKQMLLKKQKKCGRNKTTCVLLLCVVTIHPTCNSATTDFQMSTFIPRNNVSNSPKLIETNQLKQMLKHGKVQKYVMDQS